jgi:hypothetical protein
LWTLALVVVPPPLPVALLLVVPLAPLTRPPLRRRLRRVSHIAYCQLEDRDRWQYRPTEKEESDDDMGFGLFD